MRISLKKGFLILFFCCLFFSFSCQRSLWITVGVLDDQSGINQEVTQHVSNGRALALTKMAGKRNLSWKIKIKSNDTMNLPEKTANLMREIDDQVDVFLGVGSVECSQVAKYMAHYRKKVFISEAIDDSVVDHVNSTLLIQQTPLNSGKLSVRYFFSNLKKDRMLVLYDKSNLSFQGIAKGFISEGKLIGTQVFEESFDSTMGKTDFNRLLARVDSLAPQIIFFCVYEKDGEELLTLTKKTFDIPATLFINRIPDDISLTSQPDIYDQVFSIVSFDEKKESFISSQFYQSFVQQFGQQPDYYSALGYDEILLIQEMIKKNSNQYQPDLFSQLKGVSFDESVFVTGFRGFSGDGLAKRPIDIVKIQKGVTAFVETFWAEVSLRR